MQLKLKSSAALSLAVLSFACVRSSAAFSKQSSLVGGTTGTISIRTTSPHNALEAPQDKRHDEQECSTCERMHPLPSDGIGNSRRKIFDSARKIAAAYAGACAARPIRLLQPPPANAISADEASRSYDVYASTYDDLDGGSAASALGIDAARSSLLSKARGRVLEVGVGTGLNVNRYSFASGGVTALTLVDISDGMLNEARAKVAKLGLPPHVKVEFVRADATKDLADRFGRNAFDTVVDTFSLCVMGNGGARDCLVQMRDVVKAADQGGRILLIENTRSNNPLLGLYQDATAEKASQMGGKGCVYNQDVTSMVKNTEGLDVLREEAFAAGLFRSFEVVRTD